MSREQYSLGGTGDDRQVLEILQGFEKARRLQAQKDFAQIARQGRDRVFMQQDGMGGHLGSQIQVSSFHYWGQRLGYQCWDDPQFMREYLRDNEYARVQSRPRNLTVSLSTPAPARRRIDFGSANFNGLKPVT